MEKARKHVLEMSIRSSYDDLEKGTGLVAHAAGSVQIPGETEEDVMISVIEAVNNAIQHGNREEEKKQVHIRVETTPENIAICVRDDGEGFGLDLVPDPRSGEKLLNGSGRGILLMKAFMDQVVFRIEKQGTVVEMSKRFATR